MRGEVRLASENVVIQAPMSYVGSAARLWRLTRASRLLIPLALVAIVFAWVAVSCWYVVFGLLLLPYRLLRRGSRKRKRDRLRHREILGVDDDA